MTTRQKIACIESAIADANDAYDDDAFAIACPVEHGEIPGFIRMARKQIAGIQRTQLNMGTLGIRVD